MNKEDAEEYTQSLGQVVAGSWRQVILAKRLGVPQALGLTTDQWVNQRLGGYIKYSIAERREAVKELAAEGHSNREIAGVLGVSDETVNRDVRAATNVAPASESVNKDYDADGDGATNVAPIDAVVAPSWTPDQVERKAQVERGVCVVANMRDNTDVALLAWAEANNKLVRIDRKTEWGNPFEMPVDGNRFAVVHKFNKFYLPHKPGLLAKISTLRGKVLACWCHPEKCHGDIIAEIVNHESTIAGLGEHPVRCEG